MDGWFGTSDPFLRFFKYHHNQMWLLVHETEFVQDDENPIWRGFEIARDKLYGDNPSQPFKIELWDNEKNGKHQFIGAIEVTSDQIFIKEQMQFEVKTVKGEFGGHIGIKSLIKPTFIDYLKGGEQINLSIAIDYTGSNGNPKFSDSLHYNHPPDLNQQSKIFYINILKCFITGLGNHTIEQFYRIINKQHTYANALNHIMSLVPAIFVPVLEQAISMWEKIKKDIYDVQIILIEGQNDDVQIERTATLLPLSFVSLVKDYLIQSDVEFKWKRRQFQQTRDLVLIEKLIKFSYNLDLQFNKFLHFKIQYKCDLYNKVK